MLRTKSLQAAYVLPAAVALALASLAGKAEASPTADAALTARLQLFANQTSATDAGVGKTTDKAAATDLVYALYTLLQDSAATLTDAQAADLATSALDATPKLRKDRDKLVARIIDAAILGSNATANPARVRAILDAVVSNGSLAAAGKSAAVAQALKSAPTSGAAIGNLTATSAAFGSSNATAFTIAALKKVGNSIVPSVPAYIDAVLDAVGGTKTDVAKAIIAGVKTLPITVGEVTAGAAQDITNGIPTGLTDGAVVQFTKDVVALKGVKGIGEIVAGGLSQVSLTTNIGDKAVEIATGRSAGDKGLIASGALRALTATGNLETPQGILGKLATGLKVTDLPGFAANAALTNGTYGDEIATYVIGAIPKSASQAADQANALKVGLGIIKSVSYTEPLSAEAVAQAVASSIPGGGTASFNSTAARQTLAANLAKGTKINYLAAGAAVAGVLDVELAGAASGQVATGASFAAAAIKANAKAAGAIALEVGLITSVGGGDSGVAFAKAAAVLVKGSPSAGALAGGVSMAYLQNAGPITAGVITSSPAATQKLAISVAGVAANFADVEAVSQIGRSVGALVGQGIASLSKATSFSSLAATLTKAINKKSLPVVGGRKEFNWTNRVDEVGELAAVLVTAAINAPDTVTGHDSAATLASIGTSIFKSVSKKLLANYGNNLVDIKDVAAEVAGAIFQTIKLTPVTANFTQAEKDALLAPGNALLAALNKAGKTTFVTTQINNAFNAVVAGNGGGYETGSVFDPETPVKNL